MRVFLIAGVLAALVMQPALGQSFSSPIGRNPSCLNYGDKTVDAGSTCFQQFTCDFNGFMCVSNHQSYVKKVKIMAAGYDEFKQCVAIARDMDAVAACVRIDNFR